MIILLVGIRMVESPKPIWVNYNLSQTWRAWRAILGWFPYENHDSQGSGEQWARDEIYSDWMFTAAPPDPWFFCGFP